MARDSDGRHRVSLLRGSRSRSEVAIPAQDRANASWSRFYGAPGAVPSGYDYDTLRGYLTKSRFYGAFGAVPRPWRTAT